MKTLTQILALTLFQVASFAVADDYTSMTPQALQDAATAAVNETDADLLMNVMKEMQSRNMAWFTDPRLEGCDYEVPQYDNLGWGQFGTARTAFSTYAKERRLKEGDCTCVTRDFHFEDFTREFLGVEPEEIGKKEFFQLRDYKEASRNIERTYAEFHQSMCRSN